MLHTHLPHRAPLPDHTSHCHGHTLCGTSTLSCPGGWACTWGCQAALRRSCRVWALWWWGCVCTTHYAQLTTQGAVTGGMKRLVESMMPQRHVISQAGCANISGEDWPHTLQLGSVYLNETLGHRKELKSLQTANFRVNKAWSVCVCLGVNATQRQAKQRTNTEVRHSTVQPGVKENSGELCPLFQIHFQDEKCLQWKKVSLSQGQLWGAAMYCKVVHYLYTTQDSSVSPHYYYATQQSNCLSFISFHPAPRSYGPLWVLLSCIAIR